MKLWKIVYTMGAFNPITGGHLSNGPIFPTEYVRYLEAKNANVALNALMAETSGVARVLSIQEVAE